MTRKQCFLLSVQVMKEEIALFAIFLGVFFVDFLFLFFLQAVTVTKPSPTSCQLHLKCTASKVAFPLLFKNSNRTSQKTLAGQQHCGCGSYLSQ